MVRSGAYFPGCMQNGWDFPKLIIIGEKFPIQRCRRRILSKEAYLLRPLPCAGSPVDPACILKRAAATSSEVCSSPITCLTRAM